MSNNTEIRVKIFYDDTPDNVADKILNAAQNVAPGIQFEQLEGGDGFEEYAIQHSPTDFLEFLENHYYYNSGCWLNCETDIAESRSDIYQAYLNSIS